MFAAPPCGTFSVSRFIDSPDSRDGGPPILRTRQCVRGIPEVPGPHVKELEQANLIIERTVALVLNAVQSGARYIIENPADRGDPRSPLFWIKDHGPLWLMPEIRSLVQATGAQRVTFPQCAYGAPTQKYTTLLYSPSLHQLFQAMGELKCTHSRHGRRAGGEGDGRGNWNSRSTAAYPKEMNRAFE